MTIDGTPAMTSLRKRIVPAILDPAPYSVTKTAARIPSGTAMAVAVRVMSSVPTTAGPIPGPRRRDRTGMSSVRKVRSTTAMPFRAT